jgi:hypothetical protein
MDAFANIVLAIILFGSFGPIILVLALGCRAARKGFHTVDRHRRRVPPEASPWVPK